ncbi:MAG: TAXI family TRAP transporter solute-binding subunit [Pseudomonadota bacterium]
MWTSLLPVIIAVVSLLCCVSPSDSAPRRKAPARIAVLMVTGMPGETYHSVGLGMASMWTTRLRAEGIQVSAAESEGSRENLEAVRINDADLILTEALPADAAYFGKGKYKERPLTELRSIANLWQDTLHVVIRADKRKTGTLEDLTALVLATGPSESGNSFTTQLLLKSLNSGARDVGLRYMSPMAAIEAFRKGTVEAIVSTGGIPVPLVTAVFKEAHQPVGLLEVTDHQLDAVRRAGWTNALRCVIPSSTYAGLTTDVATIGQQSLLAVAGSLEDEVVYALTRTLFENLDYLARVHPACRHVTLEGALSGLRIPLHPGAQRYYNERRVPIPEHLNPR